MTSAEVKVGRQFFKVRQYKPRKKKSREAKTEGEHFLLDKVDFSELYEDAQGEIVA